MEKIRKPFQGVCNIVRFNWQFYMVSLMVLFFLYWLSNYTTLTFSIFFLVLDLLIAITIFISLAVSYYVYDISGLYNLNWINAAIPPQSKIVNINAGFDETSSLLCSKFPQSQLIVFDFYNAERHTEISIKRARKAYPPFPDTKNITTTNLPLSNNSADIILVIFASHEIRNQEERINFFKELKRVVKPTGKIIVTEHLRDIPNFLAYNIGFLHFYSKQSWLNTFNAAGLGLQCEQKITQFISTFTLTKNGITS